MPTEKNLSTAALLLKDAFRGARFALRRGRDLFEPTAALPAPAPVSEAARVVLAGVDKVAGEIDQLAGAVRRSLLDVQTGEGGRASILKRIAAHHAPEIAFAQLAYAGVGGALRRLGARDAFISEALAAEAYAAESSVADSLAEQGGDRADLDARAARLYLGLRKGGFVRDVVGADADAVTAQALFATLLWMLAAPVDDAECGAAELYDCCDMARALAKDLAAAEPDAVALTALLSAYTDRL